MIISGTASSKVLKSDPHESNHASPAYDIWNDFMDTNEGSHRYWIDPNSARVLAKPSSKTRVLGWSSTGGILVLEDCTGVELEFLRLDRFEQAQPRSQNATEEDEHCKRMRMLGARFWESEATWDARWSGTTGSWMTDKVIMIGWPEGGGVWYLKMEYGDAVEKGLSMAKNAFSMEERCEFLEQMGAKYYADPADCIELRL